MAAKSKKKKTNSRADDMVLEQSYRKTAGKYAKKAPKKQRNGFAIAVCILIPLIILGLLAYYFFNHEVGDRVIMNNVTIAGVDVGGMTKEEAVTAVQAAVDKTFRTEPMVVTILDQTVELPAQATNVTFDVKAAVNAAYALGRTGSTVKQKEEQLLAATTGLQADIAHCITIDEVSILEVLNKLAIAVTGDLVQSTWEVQGPAPDLHGEEVPTQLQTLLIVKGRPAYHFVPEKLMEQITKAYAAGSLSVVCDCDITEPEPVDLDAIFEEHCTEPKNAEMDKETFDVTPHTYGYSFDLEAAKEALAAADYGQELTIPFQLTEPEIHSTALSSLLFRDVLSSYDAFQASNSSRATNMQIACEAIDGTILMPGDVFSFNDTVGERTAAKGYQPAPSYEGGKTVMTYGGGICQPSSTIYYCALLADLEIVERDCHSYPSVYVPWGMDATVNWLTLDFKFRNNTDYPIRIDASADDKGTVSVVLMGTNTKDYYVEMESEVLAYYPHEEIEVHFTEDDNPNGYYDGQVITSPVDGYKVRTYRCIYDAETGELISRTFEADSIYSKRNKEIAVLDAVYEPDPTDPPEEELPDDSGSGDSGSEDSGSEDSGSEDWNPDDLPTFG